MPVNKNALIRYQALDNCFRNRHKNYFIEDLVDACEEALVKINIEGGVKKRQIYDDIKYMKSVYDIELDEDLYEGKKRYYRYTDTNFSINQQPISADEAEQLRQMIITLQRFRGLPQYNWIEEIVSNLENRFNLDGKGKTVVCFEQNSELKGVEHLKVLTNAAAEQKVLKINYLTYKKKDITHIFHTYYLKQYNNRWFAFGRDNDKGDFIINLALDRIEHIEPVDDVPFRPNNDIDFEHYFDDVIGVSIDNKVEKQKILLQTNESRYPYIASKPLHPSQRIEDRKKHKISIEVRPNWELEQKILSFGPDLEVLEPKSLRDQIKKKVEETYKKYFPVQEEHTDQ